LPKTKHYVDTDAETYVTEYLNTVNIPNLPLHSLKLKIGIPVILLCNLTPSIGVWNGKHLWVPYINQRAIECEILGGKHAGNMILIPCIPWLLNYLSIFNVLSFQYDWHSQW